MIADQFVAEIEEEARTTRKFLERIPKDKLQWRPHPKSMTAGQLAMHIAQSQGNIAQMAQVTEIDMPNFNRENPQPKSVQEILDAFEESTKTALEIVPTFSDEDMQETWSTVADGRTIFSVPRSVMLRTILCNHLYHHRGQLGVYLRLMGCKVPSSYGPSGDELPDFMLEEATA